MKAFTISSLVALVAAMAQAAPAPARIDSRQPSGIVTFQGADPDAYYTQLVPTDGSFTITNDTDHLSVSLIKNGEDTTCTIYGTAGSVTVVFAFGEAVVGPPQPQASGTCRHR